MTAISPDSWGRRSRLVAWWAHHEWLWGVNSLVMGLGFLASAVLFRDSILSTLVAALIASVYFPGYLMEHTAKSAHLSYLCVECMGKVPEDAGIRAQKHLRLLRAYHLLQTKVSGLAALSLIAVMIIFASNYLIQGSIFFVMYLIMAIDNFLSAFHRPLVMYCPWCKWGDGGEHEKVPTPDPVMIKTS